jgi:L-cysteate sulfo-lyase
MALDREKYRFLMDSINRLDRLHLAYLPTPLEEGRNLSRHLGGPTIFFKRDDLTGLPLTGNKTRMFEFTLAKAKREGVETIFVYVPVQSNYARQLVYACNKVGMKAELILFSDRGEADRGIQGNLFLDLLAGAHISIVDSGLTESKECREKLAQHIEHTYGRKAYLLGATDLDTALESVAYVNCGVELAQQLADINLAIDYIYVSSESATQAGLLAFSEYMGLQWKIIGVSPTGGVFEVKDDIHKIAHNVSRLLHLDVTIDAKTIVNLPGYVGPGYGVMSQEAREAMELVARHESIVLDPVYTGKAMACLLDHTRKGMLKKGENVVFLHTGGFPIIFAFAEDFGYPYPRGDTSGIPAGADRRTH